MPLDAVLAVSFCSSFKHPFSFPFACVEGPSFPVKEPFTDLLVSYCGVFTGVWCVCCTGSPSGLVGGCLPGVGLHLLTERSIILALVCLLCLGRWTRTIRRSSPCLIFVSVVATLQSLNELPEAPSESHKIRGFRAALDDDEQPA